MKAYGTHWATRLALQALRTDGYVVSSQNCWPDPLMAEVGGPGRWVGLVMSKIGVALWKPGQVERGMEKGAGKGHDVFRPGEHDGRITPRVTDLAEMLSVIDGAKATDNLWGERWAKLLQNAMGDPVQAMTGLGTLEVMSSEIGRAITIHLAAEWARLVLAGANRIAKFGGTEPATWAKADQRDTWETLDRVQRAGLAGRRNWRASMAQDVIKGRPTEIDYMNGHVVAQGRERVVKTPVSAAMVGVVREIDAGTRKPVPADVETTLRLAGV